MSEPDDAELRALAQSMAGHIRERQDFARAALGYDFDQDRRNIRADASPLEIEQWKDPYLLAFLGLGPLPGDPTIDDIERELDEGPVPDDSIAIFPADRIKSLVDGVVFSLRGASEAELAHFTTMVQTQLRPWDAPDTRAVYNHPRLLAYLGLEPLPDDYTVEGDDAAG